MNISAITARSRYYAEHPAEAGNETPYAPQFKRSGYFRAKNPKADISNGVSATSPRTPVPGHELETPTSMAHTTQAWQSTRASGGAIQDVLSLGFPASAPPILL